MKSMVSFGQGGGRSSFIVVNGVDEAIPDGRASGRGVVPEGGEGGKGRGVIIKSLIIGQRNVAGEEGGEMVRSPANRARERGQVGVRRLQGMPTQIKPTGMAKGVATPRSEGVGGESVNTNGAKERVIQGY